MRTILSKAILGIKQRGIQVLLVLALYFLFAPMLPQAAHQGFYTISLLIKDLLMWVLPITVGLFIAHAISSFRHQALLFVATLVLFETVSNLSSVWYAFLAGNLATTILPSIPVVSANEAAFNALWRLPFLRPDWWAADKGAFIGLLLGCIAAISKKTLFKQVVEQGREMAQWMLTQIFARAIPLFVLGFVARMYQLNLFQHLFAQYGVLLTWLILFLAGYLTLIFLIGSRFSLREAARNFKNLFPAGAIAFTSGCSISTMPWTIQGTAKNLKNPEFAKAVIPATTNIQQIGDCITNTFLCFLLYRHFFGYNPDLITWMHFSIVFVLARFATAAVIGGAIFIMLPIYESYLSFNAEMIAIILAFNVILDPIITSCNVVANGALCRIYEKFWNGFLYLLSSFFPRLAKKGE